MTTQPMNKILILKHTDDDFEHVNGDNYYIDQGQLTHYKSIMKQLYNLRNKISKSFDPDLYLEVYSDTMMEKKLNCTPKHKRYEYQDLLLSHNNAIKKLHTFHSNEYARILKNLKEFKHDILLGGSSVLAAVFSKNTFEPNDVDL